MLSQRRSQQLMFVTRVCVVLLGVAVSSGTSCFKPATGTKVRVGTISGSVLSSQGGGIGGATVTAQSDSGASFVATTDTTGAFSIAGVADGAGSLGVTTLPTNCTPPASVPYDMTGASKLSATFGVTCSIVLP